MRKLGFGAEWRRWRSGDGNGCGCWFGSNAGNVESIGKPIDAGNFTFDEPDAVYGAGLEFAKSADTGKYNEAVYDGAEDDAGDFAEWVALRIDAGYAGRAKRISDESWHAGNGIVSE